MPSTAVFSMTGTRAQGCIASMRGPRNVPHVSHVLASMPLVSRTLRESRQMARHIVSAKKKKGGKKGGDASEEPVVESSKVRFLSGHRRRCRRGPVDEWTGGRVDEWPRLRPRRPGARWDPSEGFAAAELGLRGRCPPPVARGHFRYGVACLMRV